LTGSEEKLAFCKSLGADVAINYKTEDFVARVKEETGGQGIIACLHDVIFLYSLAFDIYVIVPVMFMFIFVH